MVFHAGLSAAPAKVVIQEQLGLEWKDELLQEQLEFRRGELTGVALAKVSVGNAELLSQVTDVMRYDDGSIRSFMVWFFASVAANGRVEFVIEPGKQSKGGSALVRETSDTVELFDRESKATGIRLPNGSRQYEWPVNATDVPGPVQGILLPSGRVLGPGRFEVPFKVYSRATEVLASGPVFAEARVSYKFDTGYWSFTARVVRGQPVIEISEELNTGPSGVGSAEVDRFYSIPLNTGGFQPGQVFYGGRNGDPQFQSLMNFGLKNEWEAFGLNKNWFASPISGFELDLKKDQDFYYLSGYPTHQYTRVGCMVKLIEPQKESLSIVGLHTADWKNPMSLRLSTSGGEARLQLPIQMCNREWQIEGHDFDSPNYTGVTLGVPSNFSKRRYAIVSGQAVDETSNFLSELFSLASKLSALPLDRVRRMQLEWPDPQASAKFAEAETPKGKEAMRLLRNRVQFKRTFGHYGRYSMAYHYGFSKHYFPQIREAMDDPALLTELQRKEARRLCAWLAYDMNSQDTFPYGAGFHLNNPNMTIMASEARVKSSLLVKDHPMFAKWGAWTSELMKAFISRYTRDSGATYENPHYSLGVTFDWMAETNNLLIENGIPDSLDTELFRKSLEFGMNWLTPPDPRFNGHRVVLPLGNGSYQSVPPTMATNMISYLKPRYPELAAKLQWTTNQTLSADQKLKLLDKEIDPKLGSVHYKDYGVFFRHGYGTPYETLFHMMAGNCHGHYELEQDQMSYTLYAKGQPISMHFGNGYFPIYNRPWLRNRVSLDHRRQISERIDPRTVNASFTPEVEYVRAQRDFDLLDTGTTEYPPERGQPDPIFPKPHESIPLTSWSRQVIFIKDGDPKGPNYFVIRDGFAGTPTKPSDCTFWFLANSMERQGNVFHFDGQCKADIDVFVSEPKEATPETGKFGHVNEPYRRLTGFDPKFFPEGKLREDQLYLRLKQQPGAGYMVALYPRLKQDDPAATMTRLDSNTIRVETQISKDIVYLSPFPSAYDAEGLKLQGTAIAVRTFKDGRTIVISAEGKTRVETGGRVISGTGPFEVTLKGNDRQTKTFADGASAEVK